MRCRLCDCFPYSLQQLTITQYGGGGGGTRSFYDTRGYGEGVFLFFFEIYNIDLIVCLALMEFSCVWGFLCIMRLCVFCGCSRDHHLQQRSAFSCCRLWGVSCTFGVSSALGFTCLASYGFVRSAWTIVPPKA